jgi:cytochrome c556
MCFAIVLLCSHSYRRRGCPPTDDQRAAAPHLSEATQAGPPIWPKMRAFDMQEADFGRDGME